jgi:acyl carrier protein
VAPQTELEQRIAAIWREEFLCERVGTEDNFFDLGGHSLLMVRVHQRLQEALAIELPIVKLFQYPTIRALALYLRGDDPGRSGLVEVQHRAQQQKAALARQRQLGRKTGVWANRTPKE